MALTHEAACLMLAHFAVLNSGNRYSCPVERGILRSVHRCNRAFARLAPYATLTLITDCRQRAYPRCSGAMRKFGVACCDGTWMHPSFSRAGGRRLEGKA